MKVLLFSNPKYLANIGGPVGYQYNIFEYLKTTPCESIDFLHSDWRYYTKGTLLKNFVFRAIKALFKFSKPISFALSIYELYFRSYKISVDGIKYLNSYDAVHIHSLPQMLQFFSRNKITAKLILTSHTPEPVVDQLFSANGYGNFLNEFPRLRNYLLRRELKAYDVCDRIMFPVPQAREPYELASALYLKKFKEVDKKFFYVPTALKSIDKIHENDRTLETYKIPEDCLKVSYIGRHTEIKGYDFLKKAAQEVWKKNPNIYFIIGGKQEPLHGLNDKRWIELGWVNTPKLLNEVDVFVLPNKNTYFDLILLEVLRQGNPVVLTRTGGNKWFEEKELSGLFFIDYNSSSDFVNQIEDLANKKSKHQIEKIREMNIDFFRKEFNMSVYIKRYLESLNSII